MGDRTAIEWTDATWNAQVGCSRVSRGCLHCYAETLAAGRLRHLDDYAPTTTRGRFNGTVTLRPDRLDQPLRWTRPRRIFVNSMSDQFHDNVPAEWIARVFAVMALAQWHTFQVLTKRPLRMAELLADPAFRVMVDDERQRWTLPMAARQRMLWDVDAWPLPNVWLGVSIESDQWVGRADVLRATPAAVRWISAEPLVGPLPSLSLKGIDWVVVGGESGSGAAPMHPEWARDLRRRCLVHRIPFLFKQWGEFVPADVVDDPDMIGGRAYIRPDGGRSATMIREPGPSGTMRAATTRPMEPGDETRGCVMLDESTVAVKVGKRAAGRTLDGRTHDDYPEAPRAHGS